MKLSRTATYAIHAVVFIAFHDEIVAGHHIAKTLAIPNGFLLCILVMLSRAGLLTSLKGPNGGYRLARPAKAITLLDVVEAVDGPLDGRISFASDVLTVDRRLATFIEQATETERRYLRKVSMADLPKKQQ